MKSREILFFGAGLILASGAAVIAANISLKLSINAQASSTPAIVQNNKTYIPLEALQKAGVKAVITKTEVKLELPGFVGGTNQRASLEGFTEATLE